MAYRHYDATLKAEAVALASFIGAEAAAAQLGISDWRSVRRWSEKAGGGPELAPDKGTWSSLMTLALAKVTSLVAAGKLNPTTTATIAAIAARNVRYDHEPDHEGDRAIDVHAAFTTWAVEEAAAAETLLTDADFEAAADAIEALPAELLRRANAEPEPRDHRHALLAWHSGRHEVPAADVLEWAQAETRDIIATHGSLTAWHEAHEAHEAEVAREQAEWHAADRVRAEAWMRYAGCAPGGRPTYGQPTEPPIDVEALLVEADAYVETHR